MKLLLLCLLAALTLSVHAQFGTRLQAFDGTVHLTMNTTGTDNSVALTAGINGRRIPVSLTAGIGYIELDDVKQLDLKPPAINVTTMLRLAEIDFRSIDFNVYGSAYKQGKLFLEYGGKIGALLNDRTRLYANAGYRSGYKFPEHEKYGAMVYGVTFALLFWNGYNGYDYY
ncbi:MAG TPA: hypothetical protein VH396_13100 [Chitinophagaceae bacterium]|jgi:hypothetical protein